MINDILLSNPNYEEAYSASKNYEETPEYENSFDDVLKNSIEEAAINDDIDNESEKSNLKNNSDTNTDTESTLNVDKNSQVSNSKDADNEGDSDNSFANIDKKDAINIEDADDKKKKKTDKKNVLFDELLTSDKKTDKKKSLSLEDVNFFNKIDNSKLVKNIDVKELLVKGDLSKNINSLIEKIKTALKSEKIEDKELKDELKALLSFLTTVKDIITYNNTDDIKDIKSLLKDENVKLSDDVKSIISSAKDVDELYTEISKKVESKLGNIEIKNNETLDEPLEIDIKTLENNKNSVENESMFSNSDSNMKDSKKDDSNKNFTRGNEKPAEMTVAMNKDDFVQMESKLQNSNALSSAKMPMGMSSDAAEVMNKFQDLMSKMVNKAHMALSNGKSEIIISLKPESLGNINLKMTMDGDNITGKIFVDNAEIRDIFTKNMDTVVKSLAEINVNIEGLDVMLRDDMPQKDQNEFQEFLENNERGNGKENKSINMVGNDDMLIDKYLLPDRKLSIII